MSQGGKIMPNLDQNGTKVLNLTVLQRIDPTIEEILMTAAHVALYNFNIDHNQWSRKDVEGSLFVVKRNAQPRFHFIVMNRRNTENLVENLSADFEYELQVPYLLYRNAVHEVNGIWFYDSQECEEVANLFDRIQNVYLKVPSKSQVSSKKSEFEEFEGVHIGALGGPLEPSSTSHNGADVVEDSPLTNFFNVATNLGNNASTMGKWGPHHRSSVYPSTASTSNCYQSFVPSFPLQSSSAPSIPLVESHETSSEPIRKPNQIGNLLKPSSFYNPPLPPSSSSSSALLSPLAKSSVPPTVSLQPSATVQHPCGAPMLHPFPPPNSPLPLMPSNTPGNGTVIDRDKVRQALLMLVQDDQFVDMVFQALKRVHDT